MDHKDTITASLLFGNENLYQIQKKFTSIKLNKDFSFDYFENLKKFSFYLERKKKILYYIFLSLKSADSEEYSVQIKSLIHSSNEEEIMYLLLALLNNYKILYANIAFINCKSLGNFLNDFHIFDTSDILTHFFKFFNKNKETIDLKSDFINLLKIKLEKQMFKIFETKKYLLFEFGGEIFTLILMKYLDQKKNKAFCTTFHQVLLKIIKKEKLLKMSFDLKFVKSVLS